MLSWAKTSLAILTSIVVVGVTASATHGDELPNLVADCNGNQEEVYGNGVDSSGNVQWGIVDCKPVPQPGGDSSAGVPAAGGGREECFHNNEKLPSCYTTSGAWWNGSCFVGAPMASMSGESGPDGEAPEEGTWHMCHLPPGGGTAPAMCPVGAGDVSLACVWIPAGTTSAVDPMQVAWIAIASLKLDPIEVGIVPKSGEDRFGLVGLPTWMWVADPDDTSWGPVTASASDGPVSVSITARARQVFWDMGDGNVVVCGEGVPYDPVFGIAESPNCGHVYERTSVDEPDQAYLVTATTQWVVEWSGGGMTGTIEFDLVSNPVPIRVGEMQVLLQ